MSEHDSASSSEPLAHSESSENYLGSSILCSGGKQSSSKPQSNTTSKRRQKRRIDRDEDTECSSSTNMTSSVRQSLQKRKSEWEKATSSDNQELVKYHEIKKNDSKTGSPHLPRPRPRRSSSAPKNNNKILKIHNKSVNNNDSTNVNKPSNVSIKNEEKEEQAKSKCCLLL